MGQTAQGQALPDPGFWIEVAADEETQRWIGHLGAMVRQEEATQRGITQRTGDSQEITWSGASASQGLVPLGQAQGSHGGVEGALAEVAAHQGNGMTLGQLHQSME